MDLLMALLCILVRLGCPVPQAPPAAPHLLIYPAHPVQGDPLLVVLEGARVSTTTGGASFASTSAPLVLYRGAPSALFGIGLSDATGTFPISLALADGERATSSVIIAARERYEAPLGIPEKLGGNTRASQERMVSDLSYENREIARATTTPDELWSGPFRAPLASSTVTDAFGYTRVTGQYDIAHKGTDFRAALGTPVYSMNRGIVRIARYFRVYGNMVLLDHGRGLETLYLHLSRIYVAPGEVVARGQEIGLSGSSGYAERPHLHVSVHIGGVSVDPETFLSVLGE